MLNVGGEELGSLLREGRLTIAIYGLGYVGLSLAAVWLRAGARVIGVDVNRAKLSSLRRGVMLVPDPLVKEAIRRGLSEGRLLLTEEGRGASRDSEVKLITVPVPLISGSPNFKQLGEALRKVADGLKRGDLVIIESSVPPGTTTGYALPLLESRSGMKCEKDFALAYSPERIFIGRAVEDIEERYPKVVAGVGPASTRSAVNLYSLVAKRGVLTMSSPTAAEAEKLFEGIYRDVNIALANELALFASRLGLDFKEIAEVANSQPYCHLHLPGPGVGGACIPVYPKYVLHVAEDVGIQLPLIKTARSINEGMPAKVADLACRVLRLMGRGAREAKVTLLGLAFRGDINDPRLSPTYDIVSNLKGKIGELVVHDPLIVEDKGLEAMNVPLMCDLERAVKGSDLIVLVTDHTAYKSLSLNFLKELSGKPMIGVIDTRGLIKGWRRPPKGVIYVGLGRPWPSELRLEDQ